MRFESCFVGLLVFVPSAGPAAPSAASTYTVDLQRAALTVKAGKRARKKLVAEKKALLGAFRAKEDALLRERPRLAVDVYRAKAEALSAEAEQIEKSLAARQTELLDPILSRFRRIIARERGGRIVELRAYPRLVEDARCDRTAWLVRRFEGGKAKLPESPECRVTRFVFVDVERLLAGLDEGQDRARALDAQQARGNQALEGLKERLDVATARAQKTRRLEDIAAMIRLEAELKAKHQALQMALVEAEEAAEDALLRAVEAEVQRYEAASPGIWFLERVEGEAALTPACDGTTWLTAELSAPGSGGRFEEACSSIAP